MVCCVYEIIKNKLVDSLISMAIIIACLGIGTLVMEWRMIHCQFGKLVAIISLIANGIKATAAAKVATAATELDFFCLSVAPLRRRRRKKSNWQP